jgi:prepilin-type N-terminal cleavage/methylation domain-containing protein
MKKAFTLMELLVVVLILGLLATMAVGVYTTQVERARYAAARTTIATLELAVNRYQLDTGDWPPSGSLTNPGPNMNFEGSGLLHLALTHGLFDASTTSTGAARWQGPYISVQDIHLGDFAGNAIDTSATTVLAGDIQILDPWHSPYRYVRSNGSPSDNYTVNNATKLPAGNPFAATDIYYNPTTFQIVSKGPDGITGDPTTGAYGTQQDDVTNFGF